MSWIQSLRDRFLVPSRKEDPTYSAYTQFLGIGSPIYTPRNYTSLAKEGYEKNITVYRSVSLIAQSCAGIPWRLYRLGKDKNLEVKAHPVLDLLSNPNPQHGTTSFVEDMVSYWLIAGNSYVICVRPRPGAPPRELWILRPDRMSVVPGPYNISGYDYSLDGHRQFFLKEDILHLKMFAANNDWYGLSPVSVAAALVDQQNEGFDWNTAILQNMGRPSGALVATGVLGNDQYERLRKLIRERYTGKKNAGLPMLLEGGLDWKQFSMSPLELDWMESRKQNMRDISIALGVPPELLGDSANKTYCLPFETKIMTEQGPVEIGNIVPGMYVYSLVAQKQIELKKVLWKRKTGVKQLYRISCGTCSIQATGNHPFLLYEKGNYLYRKVEDLRLGDLLIYCYAYPGLEESCCQQQQHWTYIPEAPEYCELLKITQMELLKEEPVYDIEVEETHNFFAEHFCVHNSNYQEARKSFYQETILPLMDKLRDRLNVWLIPMFEDDLELRYDKEEVEALQEDRESLSGRLINQWNAGLITLNEVRDQLGMSELPGGDILQLLVQGRVFIPSDQLQKYVEAKLENMVAPPPPPAPGAPEPELHLPDNGSGPEDDTGYANTGNQISPSSQPNSGQSNTTTPGTGSPAYSGEPGAAQDDDMTGAWENSYNAPPPGEWKAIPGEEVFEAALKQYFREEQQAVEQALEHASSSQDFEAGIERVLQKRQPLLESLLKDHYRIQGKQRAKEIIALLRSELKQTPKKPDNPDSDITAALSQWLQSHPVNLASEGDTYTLYDPNFDPTQDMYWDAATQKYFDQFSFKRTYDIQQTTRAMLFRSIKQSFDARETFFQIQARLKNVYLDQIILNRAKMIAQTEAMAAFNFGGRVAAISVNIPLQKKWMATQDERTRPAHKQAHEQTRGLYEPYDVDGEKLMYPGDTSLNATAQNVVNCRCKEVYIPIEKEQTKNINEKPIFRPLEDRDLLFIKHPVLRTRTKKEPSESRSTTDFRAMRSASERRIATRQFQRKSENE